MEEKEVNLIKYLFILTKWRKLLITNFLIVAVVSIVISLLLPKWYESSAVVMPPESSLSNLGVASLVSKLPISGLGLPIGGSEVMTFVAIMKSRTVMEILVDKFDLIRLYEKKDIDRTLKALSDNIEITIGDEGQIHLSVLDRSPERAASMAGTILSALDSIYTHLNIQKAHNDRVFIEERFNQNKRDLSQAEDKLRTFQEKYGVIDIPEQTRAAIANAAELQSRIYATEIELRIKQQELASNHAEVKQDKIKLTQLQHKLSELKYGDSKANGNVATSDIFLPFDLVPEVGQEYVRLLREIEVQNKIFEFLVQMFEQAKIKEARDTPAIQILDPPSVPLYKAKPKRAIIVIVACLFSLILSCFYVAFKEFTNDVVAREGEQAERVLWIREQVSKDLRKFRIGRGPS